MYSDPDFKIEKQAKKDPWNENWIGRCESSTSKSHAAYLKVRIKAVSFFEGELLRVRVPPCNRII